MIHKGFPPEMISNLSHEQNIDVSQCRRLELGSGVELGDGKPWEERPCSWGAERNSVWLEHQSVRSYNKQGQSVRQEFVKKFKIYLLRYGGSVNMTMSLPDCILEKNNLKEVE